MVDHGTAGRPAAPGGLVDLQRAFEARGPADAPVLVLLHGTRRTRAMWRHQLEGLADTFRVVAVDLPGHGALADVPFRLRGATDLASAIIDAEAGGRAIVIGQSLGGYVGMDLAARHPEQVAGLVLANATGEPRSIARRAPKTVGTYLFVAATGRVRPAGSRGGDGAAERDPRGNGEAGRVPDGDDRTGGDPRRRADGDGHTAGTGQASAGDGRDEAVGTGAPSRNGDGTDGPATNGWLFKGGTRALVTALREVFVPRLARYPGPTLIVNGEHDGLFRHEEQAFLDAAVDGRLEVIPGSGHEVNEDQPDAFNAAIRRFAADIRAREAGGAGARAAETPRRDA